MTSHCRQDIQKSFSPIFNGSAVSICAFIESRRKKLVEQKSIDSIFPLYLLIYISALNSPAFARAMKCETLISLGHTNEHAWDEWQR